MPVKAIKSTTAMPAPTIMPQSRCRPCRPRQAIAITSALSPDNRTLIQMILPTASQNEGVCMSIRICAKNAPILPGSTICNSEFTVSPLDPTAAPTVHADEIAGQSWYQSADDLVARKELCDLDGRGLQSIGAMHGIFTDRFCVQLADGSLRSFRRIGRPHHIPMLEDGVFAFEHLNDHRAGNHEVHEFAEEGARFVNGIEGLGLFAGHADSLLRHDAQARFLDQRVDGAGQITRGCVRLDDGKGAFNRHDVILEKRAKGGLRGLYRCRPCTASDGLCHQASKMPAILPG